MSHLADRVIIVTGAGGGFGRIIASRCAERGASVVAADIDGGAVASLAEDLTGAGHQAIGIHADVSSRSDMQAVAQAAVDAFGRIDVVVNNAGIMPLAFFADHARAADAWERCIDINFKGVLNGIIATYDHMIANGRGHVVNISSIYSHQGTAGSGVYSATKAAVRVLSDSLRNESAGKIKVTVVRPTGVQGTGLAAGVVNPAAVVGIVGANMEPFMHTVMAAANGTLTTEQTDHDNIAYWGITPEELAEHVIYAIDQPWGVVISDITVRASGDLFVI